MEDIRIIPKPDNISFDDIHELLAAAHQKNYEKGIVLKYSKMSGEEIKETLGEDGRCWVALCGDKPVGTTSVGFFMGKRWYSKGKKVAHGMFTGILREYQGIGILEELNEKKFEYILASGVDMTEGDTDEDNRVMRKILQRDGYKTVGYFAPPNTNHYSVRVVKWLKGCPYTDKYINRRCRWSERLTKLRFKPGRVERSRVTTLFCKMMNRLLSMN